MTTATRDRGQDIIEGFAGRNIVIGVLGLLVLIGIFAALGRMYIGLGDSTALSDRYPWGIWIGFDFLLIAFSGAGFTMAGLVHVFRQEKYHAVVRPAVLYTVTSSSQAFGARSPV